MHRSLAVIVLLFSAGQVHSVLGVVSRIIPPAIIDVTNNALHHNGYVDSRIRLDPRDMLNHQQYHQRKVDPNAEAQAFDRSAALTPEPSIAPSSYAPPAAIDSTTVSQSSTVLPSAVAFQPAVPVHKFASLSKSVTSVDPNAAWNNQTDMACMQSLTALNGSSSNPAGLAACYNIQTFDTNTGAFQVDLRLYRICPSAGGWATLRTQAVNVGLSYSGASVAAGSMSKVKRNGQVLSWPPMKRDTTVTSPRMLRDMTFVGKIHDDQMAGINNDTTARGLLVPNITLAGTTQDNSPIIAQLSSKDASFVNGVFADQTRTLTALGASILTGAAAAIPFVLPGTRPGIFPTGLIITSVWTFLFVGTVGYGTFGRIRFRESYRRRIKARLNVGKRTI